MIIKLDKSDVLRLCMACTMAAQVCRNNAQSCDAEDRAELHEESARSWERRREELKRQISEWEEKHGTRK